MPHFTSSGAALTNHHTGPYGDEAVRMLFPENEYVQRLLDCLRKLNVRLGISNEREQWLYHPKYRTLWVWKPDLHTQPLSYIVVILAHEIGHVLDFDEKPHYREVTKNLHWSEVPHEIERSAFVRGFLLLQQLAIPITLPQYLYMIEPWMASTVEDELVAINPALAAVAPSYTSNAV